MFYYTICNCKKVTFFDCKTKAKRTPMNEALFSKTNGKLYITNRTVHFSNIFLPDCLFKQILEPVNNLLEECFNLCTKAVVNGLATVVTFVIFICINVISCKCSCFSFSA